MLAHSSFIGSRSSLEVACEWTVARDREGELELVVVEELTGMPMKDFFAWFTSPSTMLAVVYVSMGKYKD